MGALLTGAGKMGVTDTRNKGGGYTCRVYRGVRGVEILGEFRACGNIEAIRKPGICQDICSASATQ